jgi:hypothetical protein
MIIFLAAGGREGPWGNLEVQWTQGVRIAKRARRSYTGGVKGETLGALAMAGVAAWWLTRPPSEPARPGAPVEGKYIHAAAPQATPDSTAMLRDERFSSVSEEEPEDAPKTAPEERAAPRAAADSPTALLPPVSLPPAPLPPAAAPLPRTPPHLKPSTLGAFLQEPSSPPITVYTGEQDLTGQAAAPGPDRSHELQRAPEAASVVEIPAALEATAATDPTCRLIAAPEAPLRYRESVRYVQVSGDEAAVRRAIHLIPCTRPDSAACTNTRFEETCSTKPDKTGGCRSTCTVSLFVEFVYPRWDGRGTADMKARWDRFKEAIEIHENSHKAIALGHANAVARKLDSISQADCPRAPDIGVKALEDVRVLEESEQGRYDARACHAEF